MAKLQIIANGQNTQGNDVLIGPDLTLPEYEGKKVRYQIQGWDGDDYLEGGDYSDKLLGDKGNDTLVGGAGKDELVGGEGNDNLDGGEGKARLVGGVGNDQLQGGADKDELFGGEGNDKLNSGSGNDRLWGGVGNDLLIMGAGNNEAWGGEGLDQFFMGPGKNVIHDWEDGEALKFQSNRVKWTEKNGVSDPMGAPVLTQRGNDVRIQFDTGRTLVRNATVAEVFDDIQDLSPEGLTPKAPLQGKFDKLDNVYSETGNGWGKYIGEDETGDIWLQLRNDGGYDPSKKYAVVMTTGDAGNKKQNIGEMDPDTYHVAGTIKFDDGEGYYHVNLDESDFAAVDAIRSDKSNGANKNGYDFHVVDLQTGYKGGRKAQSQGRRELTENNSLYDYLNGLDSRKRSYEAPDPLTGEIVDGDRDGNRLTGGHMQIALQSNLDGGGTLDPITESDFQLVSVFDEDNRDLTDVFEIYDDVSHRGNRNLIRPLDGYEVMGEGDTLTFEVIDNALSGDNTAFFTATVDI